MPNFSPFIRQPKIMALMTILSWFICAYGTKKGMAINMEYGCIGKKLSHSFSKIIHNELCDYIYELKELAPDELDGFLGQKDFKAINVTIPYKTDVIPYLDEISEVARDIGAVNTIVNRNGKLYGYNTDFYGMRALLQKAGVDPRDKKCTVLGTGGTSKTANALLKSMGASEILTVSRNDKNGVITYETLKEKHKDVQVVINTTPCGMFPDIDSIALDLDGFSKLEGVIDAVYNPLRSKLISMALQKGIKAEGGLYMLVAQAVFAAEHFIDAEFDKKEIDRVFNKLFLQKQNIVLIGMPGCGKSTLGKYVAKHYGLEFIDSDAEIVKSHGDIPQIFKTKGEDAFRDIESEVIKNLSLKTGYVIATGGGVIKRLENIKYLKQNGCVIFIDRPFDTLQTGHGRPLSPDTEKLKLLYNERMPIYSDVCDIKISADGTIEENVQRIIESYNENYNK